MNTLSPELLRPVTNTSKEYTLDGVEHTTFPEKPAKLNKCAFLNSTSGNGDIKTLSVDNFIRKSIS